MVCKLATRIFFQRFVLLLIILSIGPVIWMLTIYKEELVWEVKTKHLMQKVLKVARQVEEWKTSISPSKISPTPKPLQLCPSLSPFLRGATDLKFDAHLTLEQVWKKNPKVQRGMFAPEKCQPIQRVAILIPYRNRERHLLYLLEHLHPFLQRQLLDYGIYVIQQAGNNVFNRAKLLNVGFLEAVKERKWDCFIFHDVDLIPENDFNLYQCDNEPKHFVVGRNSTGYKLRFKSYFGGVTAMTAKQFVQVNGFSNLYWGWGGEDDDLLQRAKQQKMKLVRPDPEIARYTMIFHKRDKGNEVNKNRWNLLRNVSKQWKEDGLNSCSYNMIAEDHQPLYINITVDIGSPHHNPQVSNRNAPPVINGI
ncbi:beta-1,4-galactosyltransferase 4-like isoform X1 [Narcine bancroftii]|uniref:beta-1,4-galactosyltransferase 4-like isoform X1 n=1 Tax=Narcine bancroftii TaxID=1343680 RepID=UPI003831653A